MRQEINSLLNNRPEFTRYGKDYARSFLRSVDFKDAEDEMSVYPGNEANQLSRYINVIEDIFNTLITPR